VSRNLQDRERMFNELKDRLGEDDPLVAQWQDELAARDAFEFRYPSKWPRSAGKLNGHAERRPWVSLFDRPRYSQIVGVAQRLESLH